jgi:hypothetical protein
MKKPREHALHLDSRLIEFTMFIVLCAQRATIQQLTKLAAEIFAGPEDSQG